MSPLSCIRKCFSGTGSFSKLVPMCTNGAALLLYIALQSFGMRYRPAEDIWLALLGS